MAGRYPCRCRRLCFKRISQFPNSIGAWDFQIRSSRWCTSGIQLKRTLWYLMFHRAQRQVRLHQSLFYVGLNGQRPKNWTWFVSDKDSPTRKEPPPATTGKKSLERKFFPFPNTAVPRYGGQSPLATPSWTRSRAYKQPKNIFRQGQMRPVPHHPHAPRTRHQ